LERFLSLASVTLSLKVSQNIVNISVSKSKVILFGGATGDTGKYVITGDTYCLDLISNKWSKLEGKSSLLLSSYYLIGSGIAPSPRAAHASGSVD
jgi:hypothetical protein